METSKYDTIDDDTGEIIDGTAEEIEQPQGEAPRYSTAPAAEIIPAGHHRAADGAVMRTEAKTAGHLLDMLEDGEYSREVIVQMQKLAAQMSEINERTGKKAKGKVTLTIDLEKEGEHFTMQGKVAVKAPELPRPKSVVWNDPDVGRFTRFPPGQAQMFGMRPVRNID